MFWLPNQDGLNLIPMTLKELLDFAKHGQWSLCTAFCHRNKFHATPHLLRPGLPRRHRRGSEANAQDPIHKPANDWALARPA
jgi:hypothetical protein